MATAVNSTSFPQVSDRIHSAFEAATEHSGTSFEYLVRTAQRESNFDPAAKARTSSAAGLFQFIESTWLTTFKEVGPSIGMNKYADHIEVNAQGKPRVADAGVRSEILNMRFDPEIASIMAGAHTAKNASYLQNRLGREVNGGELYIAHFLGANGAGQLIETAAKNPGADAVAMFPKQARANKSIFYAGGQSKSVEQVYNTLTAKHRDIEASFDFASRQKDLSGGNRSSAMIDWPGIASVAAKTPEAQPIPSRFVSASSAADLLIAAKATHAGEDIAGATPPVPTARPDRTGQNIATEEETLVPAAAQQDLAAVDSSDPATDAALPPTQDPDLIPSRIVTSWQAAEARIGRANEAFDALFANEPIGSVGEGPNPFLVSNYGPSEQRGTSSSLPSRLVSDYDPPAPSAPQQAVDAAPTALRQRLMEAVPRPLAALINERVAVAPSDLSLSPEEIAELRNRDELDALDPHTEAPSKTDASATDTPLSRLTAVPTPKPDLRPDTELNLEPNMGPEPSDTSANTAAMNQVLTEPGASLEQQSGSADRLATASNINTSPQKKRTGPLDLTKLVNYADILPKNIFASRR